MPFRLEPDTNTIERAMRPVALGRKNALVAGSDSGGRHWAIVATLIQTANLNDVEPLARLTNVLDVVSGRTKRHQLDMLLPLELGGGERRRNDRHRVARSSLLPPVIDLAWFL